MSDGMAVLSPAVFKSWSRLSSEFWSKGRDHSLCEIRKKWLMPKLAPGNGFTQ